MSPEQSKPESRRTPLNATRVIAGGIILADRAGIEQFTIRKLAAQLDVKPMTIYHHVPNKDAIIDGMVDVVFSEITQPPENVDWKSAMTVRSNSVRAVLARHSWAVPLMESRTSPGPETLMHHESVIRCLRQCGFSIKMTGHACALIDAYIYGFALQEANLPATGGAELAELAENILEPLAMDAYPYLMEFAAKHVMVPGYDFTEEFAYGLSLILDGLDDAK